MIVLLNPNAGGGTAAAKWRRFVAAMPPLGEPVDLQYVKHRQDFPALVAAAAGKGERHFVAAGGDGTVDDLLNALLGLPLALRRDAILGAVGLGSSNDFHKPVEKAANGVPFRMEFDQARPRDVGRALMRNSGKTDLRYFCINASVGITAYGNALFNQPDRILRWLKSHTNGSAITYAALKAIFKYENMPMSVELASGERTTVSLTNLGIVKNPHFSGSLRYDVPSKYNDGLFHLCAATGMGLLGRLHLLWSLSHGVFNGIPGTMCWTAPSLTMESSSPFAVELDGEIRSATRVEFSIIQNCLKVCS